MDNPNNYRVSPGMKKLVELTQRLAADMNSAAITPEHYLLALILRGEGSGISILKALNVDLTALTYDLEIHLKNCEKTSDSPVVVVPDAECRNVLNHANMISSSLGHPNVGTEHLLLALLQSQKTRSCTLLHDLGVEYESALEQLIKIIGQHAKRPLRDDSARSEQKKNDSENADNDNSSDGDEDSENASEDDEDDEENRPRGTRFGRRPGEATKQPKTLLARFCRNLTGLASEGRIDPVIGRDDIIERMLQVLCRRKKNNPLLLGEAGVGKTAIVEGLSNFIAQGRVPDILRDYKILSLDLGAVVAGTKFRGQFEERIEGIMRELRQQPKTILFIDEMHTIIGAGQAEGSLDAAGILKPALARGELLCIGATTQEEHRKFVRKDSALARRFQPITVEAPGVDNTISILNGLKSYYEAHHQVIYSDEAIQNAAMLSDRYITDRHLPDKAIDLIDEAGSFARLKNSERPTELIELEGIIRDLTKQIRTLEADENYEQCAILKKEREAVEASFNEKEAAWQDIKSNTIITGEDVAKVVSKWTGVPVTKIDSDESRKLLGLENTIAKRVVSQKEALTVIGKAIRRARAGLKDPSRPMASFLFLGPTGVGKTEIAKALANFMFGTDDAMIRIDMSEYNEKIAITRLIGAPPGYVGHESAGQLTEKVRQRPYSVVLFDEVEKAHPDVFNLLLQVLDDGRLTDANGTTVDFRNAIIIMTSNAGSRDLHKSTLGFSSTPPATDRQMIVTKVRQAVKQMFTPEFLNRLDDMIIFNPLDRADIADIVQIMLGRLNDRLREKGITLQLTPEAVSFLTDEGYAPEYGARPMRRAIQKYVEDPLSQLILEGAAPAGTVVTGTHENKMAELTFATQFLQNQHKETTSSKV